MYNWEHQDWPLFTFARETLNDSIDELHMLLLPLLNTVRSLDKKDRLNYFIDVLISEAQNTSKIEGKFMSREDIRSSILNHLSFGNYGKNIRDQRAVSIGKLTSVVAANFQNDVTESMLKYWHELLFMESDTLKIIGDYRSGSEPMRIVGGPDYNLNRAV